jgi:hypothetical protein
MSNFIVALAAASMSLGWAKINLISESLGYVLIAFLGTFCVYTYQTNFSAYRENKSFVKEVFFALIFVFLALSIFFFLPFDTEVILLVALVAALSILYCYPIINFSLRSVPYLKGPLVALIWTLVTFVLPLMHEGMLGTLNALHFVSAFFLFWGLIILVDIRDLRSDSISLRTIPQCFGWRNGKLIAFLFFIQFQLITAIFNSDMRYNIFFHVLFLTFYGMVATLNNETKRVYFTSADLLLVLLGIVFYFA